MENDQYAEYHESLRKELKAFLAHNFPHLMQAITFKAFNDSFDLLPKEKRQEIYRQFPTLQLWEGEPAFLVENDEDKIYQIAKNLFKYGISNGTYRIPRSQEEEEEKIDILIGHVQEDLRTITPGAYLRNFLPSSFHDELAEAVD